MKQLNLRQLSAKFLTTTPCFLFTLFLFFGLGVSQEAMAWELNYPTIYFYTSSNDTWDQAMFFCYRKKSDSDQGSMGWNMGKIQNTQLWKTQANENWGNSLSGFVYGITATNDWGWQAGDNWSSRWGHACANYSHTGTSQTSLPYGTYYMTSTGSSNLSVNTLSGGYSDLNKQQTVKVMISTNGGTTYTEATTNWYSNTIAASRYTLTDDHTATQSEKNLTVASNYASAVITSSITFTATADAINFTFKGWATDDQGPDDTNASYTYTVDGTKTIYAYFQEKTSLVTLVGCTEASVYAGPLTTGTATAKEPAGKEVTGFTSNGGVTNMSAMASKAVTFNATAVGTVTATFAYKTPSVSHTGTATFQIGGAAIKLNPTYTDVAADATYTWTGTGVTFTPSADVANPNVSVETAGDYSITVQVSQGGKSASQNITLTASAYSGAECGTCFGHTAQ